MVTFRSDMGFTEPEHVMLRLADGAGLNLAVYRTPATGRAPVVVWLPAMGVEARFYAPFVQALNDMGCDAVPADLRGLGGSTVRASRSTDFGYEEMVTVDTPAVIAEVRRRFPDRPIFLGGHSMGAHIGTLYLAQGAADVAGFIFIAAGTNYYRVWPFPKNLGVLGAGYFIRAVTQGLGYYPGRKLGFGGTEAKGVIRAWFHLMRTGRFRVAGKSPDYESLLDGVTLPGLMISFTDDPFAPEPAAQHLYSKLPHARVTHWVLRPEELSVPDLGHFHWVRAAEPLAARVRAWMDQELDNPLSAQAAPPA